METVFLHILKKSEGDTCIATYHLLLLYAALFTVLSFENIYVMFSLISDDLS